MKVLRSSIMAIIAAAGAVSAFSANKSSRSFLTSSSKSIFASAASKQRFVKNALHRSTKPGLSMNLFANLFGGGGGTYSNTIDYTALDYPGPELGEAALAGKVIVPSDPTLNAATFAGGCFWGLELAYQRVPGVMYTAVGYTQGPEATPTYSQVCSGATGHTEAVVVYYNPTECSYDTLLDTFFSRVDPTTVNGQGNDRGLQYRTGVYVHTPEQEALAKARFELVKGQYKRPIATELKSAMPFWPAEKYHQQYLEKGGRGGNPQSAAKGATDTIRCYG